MITSLLSNETTQALAWTLIHSLWQFTLVALLLFVLLKIMHKSKSEYRYFVGFGALGICLVMALVTFAMYYMPNSSSTVAFDFEKHYQTYIATTSAGFSLYSLLSMIEPYLLVIVNIWLLGSFLFFIKFTSGYLYIKKLVRNASHHKVLNKSLKKFKAKFDIQRDVIIKESKQITTPIVMGIVKPVILFPFGLVNQLAIEEVNAILAHELSHIKRHDYFFNIIQIVLETLFYFHPAIWFISSTVRSERENCCDDMAIEYTGNNVSYAKTLVKLQEINISVLKPALGFSGSKNTFSNRILRILDQPTNQSTHKDKVIAVLLLFTTLFVGAENYKSTDQKVENNFDVYVIDDCPQSPEDIKYYLDTIPERNTFHIKKKSKNKDVELKMEDGEITKLLIDGTQIPEEELAHHQDIIKELSPEQGKDIITLFPDCGDSFGKVYLLEGMNRKAVNMDSVLNHIQQNYAEYFDWKDDNNLSFEFEDYDNMLIDTIKDGIQFYSFDTDFFEKDQAVIIDSIWDLFPSKLPKWEMLNESILGNKFPKLIDLQEDELAVEEFFKNFEQGDFLRFETEKNKLEELLSQEKFKFFEKDVENLFENKSSQTVSDALTAELLEDGLIEEVGNTKVEITGKHMKIDNEKQPQNIWKKYKKIYEDKTGLILTKKSKIEIVITAENKEKNMFPSLFGI